MKWWKRVLGLGIVAGAAYAVWRTFDERARQSSLEWQPQPFPSPPMPVPREATPDAVAEAAGASTDSPWVPPDGDACPLSHPVKAKLASGIFHPPEGQMYARTVPDRCYRDAAAAEADGLRASKR